MNDWRSLLEDGYLSSLWLLENEGPVDFHGAFIPAVAEGIIRRWCPEGGWIWDPMAGSGTTAGEAQKWGRKAFLTDLSPIDWWIGEADARTVYIDTAQSVGLVPRLKAQIDDSPHTARFKFDTIVLHPPYHNIIEFSEKPEDLSNCASVAEFLMEWRQVVHNTAAHLKDGGYLVIVCGDIWITHEIAKETGEPYGHYPLAHTCLFEAFRVLSPGRAPRIKAIATKDIKNNQARAKQRNLWASRYTDWGAVFFETETIAAIQLGA